MSKVSPTWDALRKCFWGGRWISKDYIGLQGEGGPVGPKFVLLLFFNNPVQDKRVLYEKAASNPFKLIVE